MSDHHVISRHFRSEANTPATYHQPHFAFRSWSFGNSFHPIGRQVPVMPHSFQPPQGLRPCVHANAGTSPDLDNKCYNHLH